EGASSPSSAHPHRASADHLRCLNGFNVDIPQGPRYVKHLGGGSVLGSRGGSLSGNLPGAQAGEVDFGGEGLHPERLHGAADEVVAVAAAQQRGGAAAARSVQLEADRAGVHGGGVQRLDVGGGNVGVEVLLGAPVVVHHFRECVQVAHHQGLFA